MLTDPAAVAGSPGTEDVLFAFTIAIAAFSGLDASSALAGEVAVSRRGLKRLFVARAAAAVPYLGIALVAASTLPQTGRRWYEAPMLGVATAFEQEWIREPLRYAIALFALAILVIACNAAMFGLSRLGHSLALNRQIPSLVGRLHPRHGTPVVLIWLGALLAVALVIPADLEFLAAIYAFGATLAFTIVHLAVIRLRFREPARDRPYKIPFSLPLGRAELPLTAVLGALMSVVAFGSVLFLHDAARWVGVGWIAFGVLLYVIYRVVEDKPVFKRVTVPASALTRREVEAEFGSILVPVLGTPLDDDIMQTAGRLAGEENEDDGEGGAVIEALWVFEVPMALPLDSRVSDEDLKRARRALARAKAVGEEYEGVEVATATVRARRAGEAIVHEAKRRGVEAIVLAAEEPTGIRGGLRLGGKQGLHDTFVGHTTRYVLQNATCRVILTAPPSEKAAVDPTAPATGAAPEHPVGHPAGGRRARTAGSLESPLAMFVLVVGAGRVGSSVATSALRAGHTVSVLDEDPLSHERLDVELGQSWEEAGGRFTIGTALELDALTEAGIEDADVFIASTNGDNTNLVVSQLAQRRFEVPRVIARILDPRRAAWYEEQGVHTVCPTQIAIEQLEKAALEIG